MNTIFSSKSIFWLPGIAAIAVLGSSLSAAAETADTVNQKSVTEPSVTVASPNQSAVQVENQNQNFSTQISEKSIIANTTSVQQFPNAVTQETASSILTPVPGTVATSSAPLTVESAQPTSQVSQTPDTRVAQSDIDVGRPTRGGRSYIGIAGNVGLSGNDSSLGDGNFAVLSKIGLTNAISVRPSAIFGDNTTVLIPITYDFSIQPTEPFDEPLAIAPYIGVGAAIKTGDDSQVGFLASGGIDVPLTPQFTATAAINAGFFDETDVGLLLGVGYSFTGF